MATNTGISPDDLVLAGEGIALPSTRTVTSPRRRWLSRIGVLAATLVLVVALLWMFVPQWFTSYDPLVGVPADANQAPSGTHWFGTDQLGRDVYARIVWGTINTGLTAGLAVLIGFVGGTFLGLVAPLSNRFVDSTIMRFVDVLIAIPGFLISLSIVSAFGPGTLTIGIGVGIASIASFARVMRAEVLRVRGYDFVEASTISGASYWSTLLRHILPNAAGPVLALVGVDLAAAILTISGLGFLGFGAPAPTPEWGLLIAEGRQYLTTAWWLTTWPGLVIIVTVVALSTLSRRLLKWSRI